MRKTMAQQLVDFEMMKKALMRDLQGRCERVVELEMSLDETREQYNNVLRASNNKAQQKKMAFLERNLEQLTNVQKQVCTQIIHIFLIIILIPYIFYSWLNKMAHSRRK
jgi:kinesin family protein 5